MQTFTVQVLAAAPGWQPSAIALAPGESAAISAEGRWGVIDPGNRGLTGPGGNGVTSHGTFFGAGVGAPEGCLLVCDGLGQVLAFSSDHQTLNIHVPGLLSFIANDDPIPLPDRGFSGFNDNTGSLTVTIVVSGDGQLQERLENTFKPMA